ncbi:gamma carbonic anhydrase family protein [Floccifex sp.]|uniref:gamma carbonic anhydrase family protein n=1 Tax=Floccifex sp. TaxID=2815810 RepID=UPI002A754902|nr:gamma carbonic anhydrase family protein [Floccifex sp.]MDD7280554.1 gamma carbonic anhydrase family protein [Erysipelotrichaceae bacterium]MDY2958276.1 gamma carbonic anhydrase family protein [Floccifex sp.]
MIKEFNGKKPKIEGYVLEPSVLIGDVEVQKEASIWYGAVLRADEDKIVVGQNSNVQDNAIIHCDPGFPVKIGNGVTIGHGAIIHGCTIMDNTVIGMNATLLNGCKIGKNCIIGANALIHEGMIVEDNSIVVGVPGKVIKKVSDSQVEANKMNAINYVDKAKKLYEK